MARGAGFGCSAKAGAQPSGYGMVVADRILDTTGPYGARAAALSRPGGEALLNADWLHNKRLHADATAPAINLLAVASRLRWPSEVDWGGAGEPQIVMQRRQISTVP